MGKMGVMVVRKLEKFDESARIQKSVKNMKKVKIYKSDKKSSNRTDFELFCWVLAFLLHFL